MDWVASGAFVSVWCLLNMSLFLFPSELRELVDLHRESTDANEDPLREDEVMIIQVCHNLPVAWNIINHFPVHICFVSGFDNKYRRVRSSLSWFNRLPGHLTAHLYSLDG